MVVTTLFMTNESTDWSLTHSELFAVIYAVGYKLVIYVAQSFVIYKISSALLIRSVYKEEG